MPEHKIEVFFIIPARVDRLAHQLPELSPHPVYLVFKFLPVGSLPSIIIVDMEISVLLIGRVQLSLYRGPADLKCPDAVAPVVLECPLRFQDQLTDQVLHPLHHDHKVIPVLIHETDIFPAEISPVKDKANVLVAITFCFFQGVPEL